MKEHTINIPIYGATLCIVDSKNIKKSLKKIRGDEHEEDTNLLSYLYWNHDIYSAHWWLCIDFSDLDMGTLVHELFHATHRILEYFDVNFTSENHEPFAYLMEYLFNECIKIKSK
jgi:hypothetical protein